jgi:hypothetical protein
VAESSCEGGLVPEGAVHVDPGLLPHLDAHYPCLHCPEPGLSLSP